MKTGIFRPRKAGKWFKLKFGTFREGVSDNLLSFDVQISWKSEINVVQNGLLSFLESKNLNLNFFLSASLVYKLNWKQVDKEMKTISFLSISIDILETISIDVFY